MKKDIEVYLTDILNAIDEIETFTKGLLWKDFKKDKKTVRAIERDISIIGEVAYSMTKDFKEKYKDIPWRDIEKMRHVLIHHYDKVDVKRLWETVKDEIPELKSKIKILADKWMKLKEK